MTRLVAVDPGSRHPACAEFVGGSLVRAARVAVPAKWAQRDPLDRARLIAMAANLAFDLHGADVVAFELPQVYARSKSKGDPNGLILLAAVCGALAAHATGLVKSYKPAEWAGQVPKATRGDPWKSPRGYWIWSRLSESERAVAPHDHDSVDSVGVGLHHLGRLRLPPVLPGAVD